MNLKEERNAQQTVGFLEVDEEMTDGFNREEKASTRSRQVCCAILVPLSCLLPPAFPKEPVLSLSSCIPTNPSLECIVLTISN